MELTRDGKEVVFVWVSDYVGIRGNSAVDSVTEAYLGDISDEFIPFSDLESRVNKSVGALAIDVRRVSLQQAA